MKHAFLTLERWTTALALFGACAMLALSASLGMFQIVMRFVLEQPAEWTEVLIRFSLIWMVSVSYTHLRAHETVLDLVCRLLLDKKKTQKYTQDTSPLYHPRL